MEYSSNNDMHEHLSNYIHSKLPGDKAELLQGFADHYFALVALEDIQHRQIEDLYGAVLSHWNLALDYSPGTEKIRIYNPSLEDHDWQSPHTIIEIVVEDMPFLLQSITMEINHHGYANHLVIHPVFNIERNAQGGLLNVSGSSTESAQSESLVHLEIDRLSNSNLKEELLRDLSIVLQNVRAATEDWKKCTDKMAKVISELKSQTNKTLYQDLDDSILFLQWLHDDHFVFLGYREYEIMQRNDESGFRVIPESGLGILRDSMAPLPENDFIPLTKDAFDRINNHTPMMITKATTKAKVHRPVFMDYIGIKQYDENGKLIGEKRFLGLYSSAAYSCALDQIPMINTKINYLKDRSAFRQGSHSARALLFVLLSLPRDEVFQADEESLFECATGVLKLQERQRVRVFIRHDIYGHFVSLLIYVPRERYHTESRKKIQAILLETFRGEKVDFSVQLSESILARIHFIIHSSEGCCIDYQVREIEQKINEALAEWKDDLERELHNYYGEAKGNEYLQSYCDGFSAAYREEISARTALLDLKRFEQLQQRGHSPLGLLYRPLTASVKKTLHFKLYCVGQQATLSKSLPMLENMGVTVCDERPYEIRRKGYDKSFWMHDFGLSYQQAGTLDLENLKPRFQEAYEQCWNGKTENDGFNRLVLYAGLNWQQVNIFRAFYFYLRQLNITFSQAYVETTLANNPEVVKLLIEFFYVRFDPNNRGEEQEYEAKAITIEQAIDEVSSLDEDRILRRYLNLIQAAVRTNYFNNPVDELDIPYFACKFNSALVNQMPSPVPYFEIFVYSPRMEGIHLRGGAVARGGLRWSDRPEDFRTEVLGLMKAQMTKNSVIVPTGAKGGFVIKRLHQIHNKTEKMQETVNCYRLLIRGLLDLTDNYQGDKVERANYLRCYDEDDPYLVVAADKGTATFSDYANELSKQYGFWLGDAFASGGSAGYDHKAMGITARGAWESVKHHFQLMDLNVQSTAFTVIGIGGMGGDVFGNGMLLSEQIKLVATFDHEAIFLDPNPDPEQSYQERKRLFSLPRASWSDYNQSLISQGGGVFPRQAKSIALSSEVKALLDLELENLTPNELIRALLCAPVDLMWNGGIGTYVKSTEEHNIEVGDRSNDLVRINAQQLRCKVVGEGGNLGFTQKGRVEFAKQGGAINTDSIDNSAGVDCSDHEVNIKILLNTLIQQGEITDKQRNQLLEDMTGQVADLVLKNNYQQNRSITMIERESADELLMVRRMIEMLEIKGNLNRDLECIPNNEVLDERKIAGQGLTRPEVAVLMAYSKQLLKNNLLLDSEGLDQDLIRDELLNYFPTQLQLRFPEAIVQHRLAREIVANQLVNSLINRLGIVFPNRLRNDLGSSSVDVVNTYKQVCKVFNIDEIWRLQENLDGDIDAEIHGEIKYSIRKTIERSMIWFLRNELVDTGTEQTTHLYHDSIRHLSEEINSLLPEVEQRILDLEIDRLINHRVPSTLALKVAQLDAMFICLNVVKVHQQTASSLHDVAKIMFYLIAELNLSWLRKNISLLSKESTWGSLARLSMREEFNHVCCELTINVLKMDEATLENKLDKWFQLNQKNLDRYQQLMKLIATEDSVELEKITVILNELGNIKLSNC